MTFNRIGYLIKSGIAGIFSHSLMSFATVTIVTACLIIMGSFSLLLVNIDSLIKGLEKENDEIVAFVNDSLTLEEAEALKDIISSIPNVSGAVFVNRETAMEAFQSDYDKGLFESLNAETFRHRYVIHLSDISIMGETQKQIEAVDGIAKVNAHLEYAKGFISARNIISAVSFILIGILIVVSFFIMSNTIKLATYTRREEIAIMKMVGASNAFIRCPFIVEGLVLGIFGGLLAWFAEWGIYSLATQRILGSAGAGLIKVVDFSTVSTPLLLAFLAVGIVVGIFGGSSAIRNYLKV
ncbi:MAG: ABC transporter permease [Ruminococcaceae bacterium]|nr:ABC transporter permease [Oscillospiraceae bacterium]